MNKGKLQKNSKNEWVIWHKKDSDLVATDGGNIPVDEKHTFWLQIWGELGKEMNYVIENGKAILKPDGPDTHEYTQD